MELDKTDKIFLGSCSIVWLIVMIFVGIFEPEKVVPLLIQSVFVVGLAFAIGYIVA